LSSHPRACLLGLAGPTLAPKEREFFAEAQPLGFILFARNVNEPQQVRALVNDLRDAVGRADAPVLADQEGGRIARLRPPHWPELPAAATVAALPAETATRAVWLVGRLIAHHCADLGIDVVCAPVLDILHPDVGTTVIGDRSYGREPGRVSTLGRAMADGLLAGGVLPVAKHLPGHGRARIDSHDALPHVETSYSELNATDFEPFRALNDLPLGMTAHIVFEEIDAGAPTTESRIIVEEIIRGCIGFSGFLLSDDLCMGALSGTMTDRTSRALAAGCDAVLHCNGRLDEMREVAAAASPLAGTSWQRWSTIKRRVPCPFDADAGLAELFSLTASV
jgi:beta-N-acetylhexosaminidase